MSLSILAAPCSHAIEVKRSKFLAHALPVASADEVAVALAQVSDADATHNCWAYRIGDDYRSSDGACPELGRRGEPAGTAGRPILAAIDGQGFDRVLVVVTRWYGGTKLGAGGLVRAYGGCAAECLRRAPRLPLIEMVDLVVHVPFDDLGTVYTLLDAHAAEKTAETYDALGASLRLRLPADQLAHLKQRLRDATRDRVRVLANSAQVGQ